MKSTRTKLITCLNQTCSKIMEVSVHARSRYCPTCKAESVAARARIYNTRDNEDVIDPVNGFDGPNPLDGFDFVFTRVEPVDMSEFSEVLRLAGLGG